MDVCKDMVHSKLQIAVCTLVDGLLTSSMVLERSNMPMGINMMGFGRKENQMAQEDMFGLMVMSIMGNGGVGECTVKALSSGKLEKDMTGSGR